MSPLARSWVVEGVVRCEGSEVGGALSLGASIRGLGLRSLVFWESEGG